MSSNSLVPISDMKSDELERSLRNNTDSSQMTEDEVKDVFPSSLRDAWKKISSKEDWLKFGGLIARRSIAKVLASVGALGAFTGAFGGTYIGATVAPTVVKSVGQTLRAGTDWVGLTEAQKLKRKIDNRDPGIWETIRGTATSILDGTIDGLKYVGKQITNTELANLIWDYLKQFIALIVAIGAIRRSWKPLDEWSKEVVDLANVKSKYKKMAKEMPTRLNQIGQQIDLLVAASVNLHSQRQLVQLLGLRQNTLDLGEALDSLSSDVDEIVEAFPDYASRLAKLRSVLSKNKAKVRKIFGMIKDSTKDIISNNSQGGSGGSVQPNPFSNPVRQQPVPPSHVAQPAVQPAPQPQPPVQPQPAPSTGDPTDPNVQAVPPRPFWDRNS